MASTTHAPSQLRNRAVHLLETFFAISDDRKYIFNQAFSECHPNPTHQIDFSGSVAAFASHAVDKLLAFGCAGRGKHSLSV